ncbi:DUF2929 family protein [Kurthia sibirica]|uniref:DUF2929 domain-containing protein n=1 Tax=Kurthia sibirica TaxID=202750 RepID=A0A2U3AMS0_9BACL|nr:DUF2929 family protein [Kurthia sibirica]PWI25843.1 DUF2929 domain-containing protein [Kurthia sibirica]GEK33662.1 hypothetical protein KSI01_11950 [Kurthia sibirica]
MKYIVLLVWSAILFSVLNYVVSAINNTPFGMDQVKTGLLFSLVFSAVIVIIGMIIPSESPKEVGAHKE